MQIILHNSTILNNYDGICEVGISNNTIMNETEKMPSGLIRVCRPLLDNNGGSQMTSLVEKAAVSAK